MIVDGQPAPHESGQGLAVPHQIVAPHELVARHGLAASCGPAARSRVPSRYALAGDSRAAGGLLDEQLDAASSAAERTARVAERAEPCSGSAARSVAGGTSAPGDVRLHGAHVRVQRHGVCGAGVERHDVVVAGGCSQSPRFTAPAGRGPDAARGGHRDAARRMHAAHGDATAGSAGGAIAGGVTTRVACALNIVGWDVQWRR